jgi:2-phospho-L-lactate guanylyltransferase (CobY/MobA/RfbA family)
MTTLVVPHRGRVGKRRLRKVVPGDQLVEAMLEDVLAACAPVGEILIADAPGGQGAAVAAALAGLEGRVVIVNSDLPAATPRDLELLLDAVPAGGLALVEARDGTTNALALADATLFRPLYGPRSAARFRSLGPSRSLALPNLVDDVDTVDDLVRLGPRAGPRTRATLTALGLAA